MAENESEERGTLADAIAQHLELKKQRGATEDEIAHEREVALGPARRDVEPGDVGPADVPDEPAPDEPEPDAQPQALVEQEGEPEPVAESAPRTPVDTIDESLEFDFIEPEPEPEPEPKLEPEPEPEPESPSRSPDDPLESTPEFFEDTPEYDRLWFEEKAPSDFDF